MNWPPGAVKRKTDMSEMLWLMSANAVLWAGLGGYVAFMIDRQRRLERRLARLEREDV